MSQPAASGPGSGLPRVLVVGTGFGGIGLAARLVEAGYPVTVLEKADGVGGVWRENTYPGCACDVPSHLYSLSFAPNPDWSRRYSPGPEILRYLEGVAARSGVLPHVRFEVEVAEAAYDEGAAVWRVTSTAGETFEAEVLVPAVGQLSRWEWPRIHGLESFRGEVMHSAGWRPEVPLNGRRIAVVGTGASAVQFVPEIAPLASRLTVFQRSAPWVLPRLDHRYSRLGRRLTTRIPALQRAFRSAYFGLTEFFGVGLLRSPRIGRVLEQACRAWLRHQVPEPELRRKLQPDYGLGCKRVLFTSTFLPALRRPNVRLVTEPIAEVTPGGIRTADGVEHPADVLVLGTGFATTELLAPLRITGAGGRTLQQAWANGAAAYYGLTVPGFPNLFVLYGPNTNLGSGSIVVMLEAQMRYVLDALRRITPGSALDLRPEVLTGFDAEVQRRLNASVWAGCASWYRAPDGRIVTNWPGLPSEYVRRARFSAADYRVLTTSGPVAAQGETPVAEPVVEPVAGPVPVSTAASGRGSGDGDQRPSTTA